MMRPEKEMSRKSDLVTKGGVRVLEEDKRWRQREGDNGEERGMSAAHGSIRGFREKRQ